VYQAECEILIFGVDCVYFTFLQLLHLEFVERCKSRWTVENETWKQWIQRAFQAGNADLPEE